jgi:hypothetical protein
VAEAVCEPPAAPEVGGCRNGEGLCRRPRFLGSCASGLATPLGFPLGLRISGGVGFTMVGVEWGGGVVSREGPASLD